MSKTAYIDDQGLQFEQAIDERKQYDFDFGPRMPSGVTLSSAVAKLTDPDDNTAAVGTAVSVSGSIATVTVLGSEIDALGEWELICQGTLSNSETPALRCVIQVVFDASP